MLKFFKTPMILHFSFLAFLPQVNLNNIPFSYFVNHLTNIKSLLLLNHKKGRPTEALVWGTGPCVRFFIVIYAIQDIGRIFPALDNSKIYDILVRIDLLCPLFFVVIRDTEHMACDCWTAVYSLPDDLQAVLFVDHSGGGW